MALEELVDELGQQQWLDPISDVVQQASMSLLNKNGTPGKAIDNFLNGTWLGHPLHPILVEIPVGTWSAALIFDALAPFTRSNALAAAADASIVVGIFGALGSVATGISQWQYTDGSARRKGMLHALLNTTALALYTVSWGQRRRGKRFGGFLTSALGYTIASASAYIGGDLAYGERIGMDHAPGQTPPDDFVAVLAEAELPEGTLKRAQAGEVTIVLARQNGQVYALADECSHLGGPLSEGELAPGCVTCPWHFSQFSLADGHILNGPATFNQPHYETRIRNGQIEVRSAGMPPK